MSLININNRIQSVNNLKQDVYINKKKQNIQFAFYQVGIDIQKGSYYAIDDYIKPLDNKNRKYRRIIVNKMENQLSCSNIVLKSVKDVAELKQKLGKRVPFEMEQISQMFNQNQNSSFNFDVLNARKNFSAKNQDVDDKMNIKQAFFRRYAEMNVGRDRVVEDCGFDMMMLGNKAKSLNIKNPVITQSVKQFIPRNRFLALNKIMRLKSPKKLEPLSTLNNLKVNTSLVFKNEDKPEEKSQEIQISIRKRRLLPLLSDQGRTSAFSRSQRTDASPQISPKPSSSMQQTPNYRPTPSISPTTQKRALKNESIKPIKKQTMYTLKQLLKNRRKKEDNKKIEKKGRNILTEGNEDSGHKKNYTPLEPWKIQIEGADFQFIA